jgi:hexokinase
MSGFFQSIAANANQLTVTALLAILIVSGVLALHRGWVVLGSTYDDCVKDRDRFEEKVEALATANEVKIARLEADNFDLRSRPRGRTAP